MIRVTIADRVYVDGVPPELLSAWKREFTLPNPAYLKAVRDGRYLGSIPREICGFTVDGDRISFARGTLSRLRAIAREHGEVLTFRDERLAGDPIEVHHTRELRPYQARAVDELLRRQQGIVVAPAGAGKTSIACGLIARWKT